MGLASVWSREFSLMKDERQEHRRRALLIILVALIVTILCWLPIGYRLLNGSGSTPPDNSSPGAPP